jgi:hypothetical protein
VGLQSGPTLRTSAELESQRGSERGRARGLTEATEPAPLVDLVARPGQDLRFMEPVEDPPSVTPSASQRSSSGRSPTAKSILPPRGSARPVDARSSRTRREPENRRHLNPVGSLVVFPPGAEEDDPGDSPAQAASAGSADDGLSSRPHLPTAIGRRPRIARGSRRCRVHDRYPGATRQHRKTEVPVRIWVRIDGGHGHEGDHLALAWVPSRRQRTRPSKAPEPYEGARADWKKFRPILQSAHKPPVAGTSSSPASGACTRTSRQVQRSQRKGSNRYDHSESDPESHACLPFAPVFASTGRQASTKP